jgi:hypothetical protein
LGLTYGNYEKAGVGSSMKSPNAKPKLCAKSIRLSRLHTRRAIEKVEMDRRSGKIRTNLNTPIGKLPIEIRRMIFKKLLPHGLMIHPGLGTNDQKKARTLARAKVADSKMLRLSGPSSQVLLDQGERKPFSMAMSLLTADSTVFGDVAEMILYEDQTFVVNIYEDGVEFLDLPRIPKLANITSDFAASYSGGFKVFENGRFSFGRFKKLVFNIHSPALPEANDYVFRARDASIRMQENIAFLVSKITECERPLRSIVIEFFPEVGTSTRSSVQNNYWIRIGSSFQPRSSHIQFMSTVELMLKPFRHLRHAGKVQVYLPEGLELNGQLNAAVDEFRSQVCGDAEVGGNYLQEKAMSDAFEEQRYRERCIQKRAEDMTCGPRDARDMAHRLRLEPPKRESYHLTDEDFLEEVSELGSDFDSEEE